MSQLDSTTTAVSQRYLSDDLQAKERERERDRDTEREIQRQRDRERVRKREKREKARETETETETEIEREREREKREKERDRKIERMRGAHVDCKKVKRGGTHTHRDQKTRNQKVSQRTITVVSQW